MPPPPPPPAAKPPPKTAGRANLLSSIEGFKKGKLKKTKTVEKAAPLTAKNSGITASSNAPSSNSGGSNTSSAPMGMAMGGLFAGGIPSLRKTGRPGAATMLPTQQKTQETPKENNPPVSQPITPNPAPVEAPKTEKALPIPPRPQTPAPKEEKIPKQELPLLKPKEPPVAAPVVQAALPTVISAPVTSIPARSNTLTNPVLQRPSNLTDARNQRSASLLPKISYQKMEIDLDDIEEHPSIPRYHNPLSASLQAKTHSSANTLPVIEQLDIPEEEPLPFDQLDVVSEPLPVQETLFVETIDNSGAHQPKAACELQPKRQKLLQASREGDIDEIMNILQQEQTQLRRKELLNGLDIDLETNKKSSPLHVAIEHGHLSVVATLLSQGANPLLTDPMGDTAVHTACKTQNSASMEIFSFLMNSACNVKAQNQSGNTPLHVACMVTNEKTSLYPQMIYTLVTNPFADLLIQNAQGFSVLMYAAQSGDIGVVKLILSRLSTVDAITLANMNGTVLTSNGPQTVNAVSLSADRSSVGPITRLLMEYGAEPSPGNKQQASLGPLLSHLAVPPVNYPSNRLARIIGSGMPCKQSSDDDAIHCLQCEVKFSVVTRRHHCRSCGMVYCNKCSNFQRALPSKDKTLRVCEICYRMIGWYSPLQLVSSQFFIQREASIYRQELEEYRDDSVNFVVDRFDQETNLVQIPICLVEPTWNVQVDIRKFKLDDAFTVSKLPTGQGHLPDESYCSLFEFAAMYERLKMISVYCLDIHDMLETQEISLSEPSATNSINESQQRATAFILLVVGAQIYSLISRMSDNASLYKFLDSSYHKIRAMLQFICELKPCADSNPIEFSFAVLDKYDVIETVTEPTKPSTPTQTRATKNLIVSDVDIDPLPVAEDVPVSEDIPKANIFGKLFSRRDSQVEKLVANPEGESKRNSSEKLIVTDVDIEPLPIKEQESTIEEEKPKAGLFSKLFTRKPSEEVIVVPDDSSHHDDIPLPPGDAPPPPPPPAEEATEESGGLFSKFFTRKAPEKLDNSTELPEDEEVDELLDVEDVKENEIPKERSGVFSKLFQRNKEIDDPIEPEEASIVETDSESETAKNKPILKFFRGLRSSSIDAEETERDEETSEPISISEPEQVEEKSVEATESKSMFSWFSRKKKEENDEKSEKNFSAPSVPAPSPSLDLEEDEVLEIPAAAVVPKESANFVAKEISNVPEVPAEVDSEEPLGINNIETSQTPNLMSEMKNKLSAIPLVKPIETAPPVPSVDLVAEKNVPVEDVIISKPLPMPPSKSGTSGKKEKQSSLISTPNVEPEVVEPLPDVENNLFADGDDEDEDFLFTKPLPAPTKKEENNFTKPLPTPSKASVGPPKTIEAQPKEENFVSNEPFSASKLAEETKAEKPLPVVPQKTVEVEKKNTSNLFGVDEELFLASKPKQEAKPEAKCEVKEKSQMQQNSLFDSVDDDLSSISALDSSKNTSAVSEGTSLFGETDDAEDSLFGESHKTQEKPTKKLNSTDTASSSNSLFGDEDFSFSRSTNQTKTKPAAIAAKETPSLALGGSSSLFDFPDEEENDLFASKKAAKPKTTKTKKSTLFDDNEDLFSF